MHDLLNHILLIYRLEFIPGCILTFYIFLKSLEPDSRAFCRRAMDYDILLVPGDDFGCPGYARLAYCVARSQIERSLPAFRKLAGSYGLCK